MKQARIDSKKYFVGAPFVQMDYSVRYPEDTLPSEWFSKEVTRKAGLQTHEPKKKKTGQSIVSRLLYPIKTIVGLGKVQPSCDFIGKMYISGSKEPVNIFATSFYQVFKLYQIWLVYGETAESAITKLLDFWSLYPLPHVMRVDNGMSFRGTGVIEGKVGRFVKFLLNLNITPLFSAAYQAYTNPHIEGHNRTFDDKLWRTNFFTSLADLDTACIRFNAESSDFFAWKFKERLSKGNVRRMSSKSVINSEVLRSAKGKKICFIRFVQRWKEANEVAGVVVLNKFVEVPTPYLNQYVFVTINLETTMINIISESNGQVYQIINQRFELTL